MAPAGLDAGRVRRSGLRDGRRWHPHEGPPAIMNGVRAEPVEAGWADDGEGLNARADVERDRGERAKGMQPMADRAVVRGVTRRCRTDHADGRGPGKGDIYRTANRVVVAVDACNPVRRRGEVGAGELLVRRPDNKLGEDQDASYSQAVGRHELFEGRGRKRGRNCAGWCLRRARLPPTDRSQRKIFFTAPPI